MCALERNEVGEELEVGVRVERLAGFMDDVAGLLHLPAPESGNGASERVKKRQAHVTASLGDRSYKVHWPIFLKKKWRKRMECEEISTRIAVAFWGTHLAGKKWKMRVFAKCINKVTWRGCRLQTDVQEALGCAQR